MSRPRGGANSPHAGERPPDASGLDKAPSVQVDATSGSATARWATTYRGPRLGDSRPIVDPRGWALVIRGNPANAAEGLCSVSSREPIWLTVPRA